MAFPYFTIMIMLGGIVCGIHALYKYHSQNPPIACDVRTRRSEPEDISDRRNRRSRPYQRRRPSLYDKTCTICMESITPSSDCRLLLCHHVFHSTCIQAHLTMTNQSVPTCPNCRAQIEN